MQTQSAGTADQASRRSETKMGAVNESLSWISILPSMQEWEQVVKQRGSLRVGK